VSLSPANCHKIRLSQIIRKQLVEKIDQYQIDTLSDQEILKTIQEAVSKTHHIMVKVDMLLKYWILTKYHQDPNSIPKINQEVVSSIIQCVTSKKINGNTREEKKHLIEELQKLNPFTCEDAKHLTQILAFEKARIVTNYETNIKEHFKKYVTRYVKSTITNLFPLGDKPSKEQTKQRRKEIGQIIKIIMTNTPKEKWTCPSQFHPWITDNKPLIVPDFIPPKKCLNGENTHYYHVSVNPQLYLRHMIYMNLQIETLGGKLFRCFPMRSDIIPKHITIDTETLITLLVHPHADLFTNNVMKYQDTLWNSFFDVSRIKRNGYVFNHMLVTDGYVASVCLMDQNLVDKKIHTEAMKKAGRKKQRESGSHRKVIESTKESTDDLPEPKKPKSKSVPRRPEFLYMDEVDPELLTKAEKTFVIDGGKRKLLSMMDTGNQSLYTYSNGQRLHETRRLKYLEKLRKFREKNGILKTEEELGSYNAKTCHLEEFLEYMKKKIEINTDLYGKYESTLFRQYRWYGYLNNLRSDQKLIESIVQRVTDAPTMAKDKTDGTVSYHRRKKRKHKQKWKRNRREKQDSNHVVRKITLKLKDPVKPPKVLERKVREGSHKEITLIFGDWSVGKQMRNFISTPNVRLMRLLADYFQIYYLDEFRTSCLHWKTEEKCGHLSLPDGKGVMRSRHSILTYQMENKRLGCIDRDRNACHNMIKLYQCCCLGQARPLRYCRDVSLDDE
jgi:hypothetical protein